MSTIGQCRFAVRELEMSASLAVPSFGRLLYAAFRTRMSTFRPPKSFSRLVRIVPIDERVVMSATTPFNVGAVAGCW